MAWYAITAIGRPDLVSHRSHSNAGCAFAPKIPRGTIAPASNTFSVSPPDLLLVGRPFRFTSFFVTRPLDANETSSSRVSTVRQVDPLPVLSSLRTVVSVQVK